LLKLFLSLFSLFCQNKGRRQLLLQNDIILEIIIQNSHFPLGKCHFISHIYLWYIFASIHPFGLPEEFCLIPALCRYMVPLPRPHDREISSHGGHLCSIIYSSVLEAGHEIRSSRISTQMGE
jgi:hypothetical protein